MIFFISGQLYMVHNMAGDTKSALKLLSDYGCSDSSEEEESVPGAKVSVKRTAPAEWDLKGGKKGIGEKVKLPLPTVLSSLYKEDESEKTDDPQLHDGRVRSFPHERGNWVTFIYIPYEPSPLLHTLLEVFCNLLENVAVMKPVSELHISLTQTLVLRHHWIEPFVESVSKSVKELSRFQLSFGSVNVYCNEEKTRTFIGLTVSIGCDILMDKIKVLDKCVAEFKLPVFHKDPSFHMSIGWCLGNVAEEISSLLPELNLVFQQIYQAQPDKWTIDVEKFICKAGNKYFACYLKK